VPDTPVLIAGDPVRLEQVLGNLLANAAKYTPEGGEVAVLVEPVDAAAPRVTQQAVVRVRDTGIGMPPEVLNRVFDLFFQADQSLARTEGGLGIRVSLVRSLVELHGGTVQAFSGGAGQGSEFVVHLPLASSAGRTRAPAHAGEDAAAGSL
jgi:two-component system, sensor histidine kinase